MSIAPSASPSRLFGWLWLPTWVAIALFAIFVHGPMPLYSTRTLAVAWDMWCQHHWLVPSINGEPYSEKAPLLFWLIEAGWIAFAVNDIWPRLLQVSFGGIELVLVALLARRLFPTRPQVADYAPWLLAALNYALLFNLQIMYDVLLADWALAALYVLLPSRRRAEPRWLLYGLLLGGGLLSKGPVMLLHAGLPWLLGPWWSDWARAHRRRWYARGLGALLLAAGLLLAWAIPAGFAGGEAYRHHLLFTQTAGRIAYTSRHHSLQSHARPTWWYLWWLPALLFPISAWPRAWLALIQLRRPLEPGLRFLLSWLGLGLLSFSLISGKQLYYLLPEYAAAMLLIAAALDLLQERQPRWFLHRGLGGWPLGLAALALGGLLLGLPYYHYTGATHPDWFVLIARHSPPFGYGFIALALLAAWPGRAELQRIALAGMLGALSIYQLFNQSLWPKFDLAPTAQLLHQAEQAGQNIGQLGSYAGQYHFAGRLRQPIRQLDDSPQAIEHFARQHPKGLIIVYPDRPRPADLRSALLVQPFRGTWLAVWPARSLALFVAGKTPPPAATRFITGTPDS